MKELTTLLFYKQYIAIWFYILLFFMFFYQLASVFSKTDSVKLILYLLSDAILLPRCYDVKQF